MAMYDSDEHWNNLETRDIHFLHRWKKGDQPNFYFTKQTYLVKLSTKGEGVKKVQNLFYVEKGRPHIGLCLFPT